MKTLKMAKFLIYDIKNGILLCCAVNIFLLVTLIFLSINGNVSSSGLDFTSIIFLLIIGLSIFRNSFVFSQLFNISRKTYIKSIGIVFLATAIVMSIFDIILNRIHNIFYNLMTFDIQFYKVIFL